MTERDAFQQDERVGGLRMSDQAGGDSESDHQSGDQDSSGSMPRDEDVSAKVVPVSEAIRYRKRAQAAEIRLHDLDQRLAELESELGQAHDTIQRIERRHEVDERLRENDVVDLDVVRLLVETILEESPDQDVAAAVEELHQRKPFLFRSAGQSGHRSSVGVGSMTPSVRGASRRGSRLKAGTEEAAMRAMGTGRREDLLHYMKLRRSTQAAGS